MRLRYKENLQDKTDKRVAFIIVMNSLIYMVITMVLFTALINADSYCEKTKNGSCPKSCNCASVYTAVCFDIEDDLKKLPYCLKNLTITGQCHIEGATCLKRIQSRNLFSRYAYLENLTIEGTFLKTFPKGIFDYNRYLRVMNLHNNKLMFYRNSSFFSKLDRLRQLNLSRNIMSFVDNSMFKGLKELTDLDLSSNYIKVFTSDVLKHSPKLTHLSLQGNRLRQLSSDLQNTTSNVKFINLMENSLKRLNADSFQNMRSLQTIYMDNNDLVCSCELYELILNLNKINANLEASCTPEDSRYRISILYIAGTELDCGKPYIRSNDGDL